MDVTPVYCIRFIVPLLCASLYSFTATHNHSVFPIEQYNSTSSPQYIHYLLA